MDSKIIELQAVLELNKLTAMEGQLYPNIPVNDKNISFDGFISVYQGSVEHKKNWLGDVDVQVKGRVVKRFSGKGCSYPLTLSDLENYYKNGGAVVFVGEIKESTKEVKLYYKHLLPLELRSVIRELKNRDITKTKAKERSKTIKLKQLSETTLNKTLRSFMREAERQHPKYVQERHENIKFNGYKLTSTSLESDVELIGQQFFLHGEIGETTLPLEELLIDKINMGQVLNFTCQDSVLSVFVDMHHTADETTFLIENTLELKYNPRKRKSNLKVKFQDTKSLSNLKKATQVFLQINSLERCYLGDIFNFAFPDKIISDNELISLIDLIEKVEPIFVNDLKVGLNNSYGSVKIPKLISDLEFFIDCYIDGNFDLIDFEEDHLPSVVNFKIGNMQLTLYYSPGDKGKEDAKLYNLFSEDFPKTIGAFAVVDDKEYRVSPYLPLEQYSLEVSANFNQELVINSLVEHQVNDPYVSNMITQLSLNLIRAFDNTNRKELLETAEAVLIHLGKQAESVEQQVNLLQCLKRSRPLTIEEKKTLVNQKKFNQEYKEFLFSANVLLEYFDEAEFLLEDFTLEELEEIERYPIYDLYIATKPK
ncbi:hypothetical protein JCM19047_2953 [Bacillus sp. JCM 19047]|nr:hypothetical protein JCM19047_2953 [Bacillus sp. JCM 19047]